MPGVKEGGSRVTSASGRRHSVASSVYSDEEGFPTSKSPSAVLAYKEVGSNSLKGKYHGVFWYLLLKNDEIRPSITC